VLAEQLTGQVKSHLSEIENNTLIHTDVVSDFHGLQEAARSAGFNLQIASGFRSFTRQLLIWNDKYSGNRPVLDKNEQPLDLSGLSELEKLYAILHWSALPGASRHHWGTDLDIFAPNLLPEGQSLQLTVNEYCNGGYFQELTNWLSENMATFGFYRPYHSFTGGVAIEPWHISYYPIADKALAQLDANFIADLIIKKNILGKSLICQQLPMIYEQFICNINPQHIGNHNVRKT
jgi:LAS superfamily LD-carboxypeptidase LdcB